MRMRTIIKDANGKQGYPNTRQRSLLLSIICEAKGHIDAKELFRRASGKDSSISTATVYRNLHLFKELGLIEERRLGQARCSYELKHPGQHQHLVCSGCGRTLDFECPLSELVEKIKSEQGFLVTRAELFLEGFCPGCAEDRK